MLFVLIDTWWNVNIFVLALSHSSWLGFNRYMVECELQRLTIIIMILTVLIDTWWNVN